MTAPQGSTPHVYKTVGDVELKLFVFAPEDHKSEDRRPAIVFFFGGGFVGGNIEQFLPQAEHLAGRGMVAVRADYRVLNRHGTTPVESCADGRSAVRWLRANAGPLGIDPDRIAAAGGSAGGTVAAMTGLVDEPAPHGEPHVSSLADAMVLFNPALVFAPIEDEELRPADRLEVYIQRWQKSAIPETSAWHHVTPPAPPTLIHHGDADTTVPIETARAFTEKMRSCGVRCELDEYPGEGHGFFNHGRGDGICYRKTLTATDRFLASLGYLDGPPTIGG